MLRNKSLDVINLEKSKVDIDSLVDYIDLHLFDEYQVIVKNKRSFFKNKYVRHYFTSRDGFTNFVGDNDELKVCSICSEFNNDTCILSIWVK